MVDNVYNLNGKKSCVGVIHLYGKPYVGLSGSNLGDTYLLRGVLVLNFDDITKNPT